MLSLNDRFGGLSRLLHLTTEEASALNKVKKKIASLQQTNQYIQFNSLPQNTTNFLKIHKKIEHLRTNEKLTEWEDQFFAQIDGIARKFEEIVFQVLSAGNSQNPKEIEALCRILDKLNKDPLLKNKINPELFKEMETLAEQLKSVADSCADISYVQNQMEAYEQLADNSLQALTVQQEVLEQGGTNFTNADDLTVLDVFDQFVQLYIKYGQKDNLSLYQAEFISRLTQDAYAIRFNRGEFCSEFQAAVEAEVLKTLQAIHQQTPSEPVALKQYEKLQSTLIEARNQINTAKATLGDRIDSLDQSTAATKKLFKEFGLIHEQLDRDVEFLDNQIAILIEKKQIGWGDWWTISSRDRQVKRNVRLVKEIEEDKPASWGKKVTLP